jgi:hypothetical protein
MNDFRYSNCYDDYLYVFSTSSNTAQKISSSYLYYKYGFVSAPDMALVPVLIPDSDHLSLPDCFLSYYSNILGSETPIEFNGERYYYTGYIAIKE